jgi:hypothetical protein
MLTPWEFERQCGERGRALKATALTPGHAAAEGAMDGCEGDDGDQGEELRRRVQHEADPWADPAEMPEVEHADAVKLYRQAFDAPTGYPAMGQVSPEAFRRGPVTAGEAAYSPAYDVSARPVPVPSGTLNAAAITLPLITSGQSAPSAGRF